MTHTLFIRTVKKDFPYLEYCLRSIGKFATGFETLLLVPNRDAGPLRDFVGEKGLCLDGVRVHEINEWPGKGMLHGMFCVMNADHYCPNSDFIFHIDSDCVFEKPVSPETFMVNGKPLLRFEYFDSIIRRHGGIEKWRVAVEKMLPFSVPWECMRSHPEVYHRGLYAVTRHLVEQKMKQPLLQIFQNAQNQFPQDIVEFPALGAVAMQVFPHLYEPFNMASQANPDLADWPIQQFWSHGDIDKPQHIWVKGQQKEVVPIDFIRNLGLA